MKKSVKIPLIVGAVLICIGLIIVIAVGLLIGWKFETSRWESKVYESDNRVEITDIDLDFSAGSLTVQFYKGNTIKVEYPENNQVTTTFGVTGSTLKIATVVHWRVQFLWFNNIPATTVYIPDGMLVGLKMKVNAGTVTVKTGSYSNVDLKMNAGTLIMDNVDCNGFNVDMNAGTMKLSRIQSATFAADLSAGTLNVTRLKCDDVHLDISAGTAKIGIEGKKSDYSIWTDVSAGSCNVKSQNGATIKKLTVDVSAGTAKITFDE